MASERPEPAVCRAGCAQQVITPSLGVSLCGYFHDRVAKWRRDDLYAHAVVIESGGSRVALVSCDIASPDRATFDAAKSLIEQETGIPPEHVLICATHTHTAPQLRPSPIMPQATEWAAVMPRLIADAVKAAAQNKVDATLHLGSTQVEGYSFNRLFRLKNAREVFGQRGEVITEAGPIDPQLQTLSVVDLDGNLRGMAVNFALHPDVIGGSTADFLSADWPGELCSDLSKVYGDDVVGVFLQGTCGDINHHIHRPTHLPKRGPKKAVQIGRALAGAAMLAAGRAEPMTDVALDARALTLSIPYYTRDAAFMADIAALKAKPEPSASERFTIERAENWPYDGQDAEVPVCAMRIGDLGLVGLPAEIFVRIGLEIKHFSPAPATFVVELANARSSTYVPTADQAHRDAYGAKPILSRWLCADAGRRMADAAQAALWEMWPEK